MSSILFFSSVFVGGGGGLMNGGLVDGGFTSSNSPRFVPVVVVVFVRYVKFVLKERV